MATINSGYSQGSSFTNASGPTGMNVSPYLLALLQREGQFLGQRAQSRPGPSMGGWDGTDRWDNRSQQDERSPMDQSAYYRLQAMKNANARDMAQTAAATGLAPTKISTVGGQSFATPDALSMTAPQRQAFLPQNAGQQGGFGDPQNAADLDWQRRMQASRDLGWRGGGMMTLSGARGATPQWSGR